MLRLFFALWPDELFIEQLQRAVVGLEAGAARATAAADLHVTLCFLGSVQRSLMGALCERAAAIRAPRFELVFETLEYWPRSQILTLSAAAAPAAAIELSQALHASARALGLSLPERPFRAHVTLLRGAAAAAQLRERPRLLAAPLRLAARSFDLAQSHALEGATAETVQLPRYLRLVSWPLTASAL